MSTLLTQQLDLYDRDGIVFPIKVLSDDETDFFRRAFLSILDDFGQVKRLDNLHLFFDWAYRLATHDRLLNVIESLLGDDLLVFSTLIFHKPPRDSSYASWHQDSFYSGLHLTPSTSAWIALTPSYPANGCMRVIPGSHKEGLLDHTNVRDDANLLRRGERIVKVDESRAMDVILRPGEMSLHQSTIVHGSNANTSGEPRIGFIVRFVTSKIKNQKGAMLRARGKADCSHLILATQPVETDTRSAFEAWQAYSNAQRQG
ncbi:MAG: phytanoyl-CoA dioxygenase family protein [Acidobacteriota bacterium]